MTKSLAPRTVDPTAVLPLSRRVSVVRSFLSASGTAPASMRRALISLAGLPGSGKSHLARDLHDGTQAVVVRTDEVRQVLFPAPTYTRDESGTVYQTCFAVVRALLRDGFSVVFDGTNGRRAGRRGLATIAKETGASHLLVLVTADDEVVRGRIIERQSGRAPSFSSGAVWEIRQLMAASEDYGGHFDLVVDTGSETSSAVNAMIGFLRGDPGGLDGVGSQEGGWKSGHGRRGRKST
ncbi:MAG: ATP-binding protein [Chloroflexi bacterium]|nr:MAG: ATP-binding protein [Chloroflexota bacterium]